MSDLHPAIGPGETAVITGAGNGIGRSTAARLAELGMTVCLVDIDKDLVEAARASLPGAGHAAFAVDVSDRAAMDRLAAQVARDFGRVSVLMNNAGVGGGGDLLAPGEAWTKLLGVNLFGVLNGVQAFLPGMIEAGLPGAVINTGSKQGITQPPGNTAYNVSKSAVKSLTEGLAHTLRNQPGGHITAHLLIPGFTWTGMTRRAAEMPPGAWTPEQVTDRLLQGMATKEFYILCEDNETPRALDEKRMLWNVQDIIENRPALSRWHPDYADAFAKFVQG